ncbi:MAG: hormogonium polysaccharide biosynthesis glycosyltransferase HpsE [Cyanobacteria bacterium P01_F01_bin.4]
MVSSEQLFQPHSLQMSADRRGLSSDLDVAMDDVGVAAIEFAAVDITVVIPTYNGASRVSQVLDKLRSQRNSLGFTWEVIVCDNNSTDETEQVVRDCQTRVGWWPSQVPLHYRFAAEQGAAHARQYAVESAHGQLIAFLDDDNLPSPDWLESAYRFAKQYPQAGAFGSQIHGDIEGPLPDGFDQIKCFLAIIERGDAPHLYQPKTKILPPAAGLVVRRAAWLDQVPKRLFLNNKGKDAGLASEDLEALLHIQTGGWEVWYNPEMVVHHQIPNSRVQRDYLVALFRCVGLSRSYIRMLGIPDWQRPLRIPPYVVNDFRRLVMHYVTKPKLQKELPLLDACKREHLTSSLVSPLFLLRKTAHDRVQGWQAERRWPDREQWLGTLTKAFENRQFQLFQQVALAVGEAAPQFEQRELLVRLVNNDRGPIMPDQFFPIAHHYGVLATLDRWIIRQFFDLVSSTGQMAMGQGHYAINLSIDSVKDRRLLPFIASQLEYSGLSPEQVCFEVSAATVMALPEASRELMYGLHELRCGVTIDDFSPTQSSTRMVKRLPVDYLKLSRQWLWRQHRLSFESLGMLRREGLTGTIAKGVETPEMLQSVQRAGILYAQGYQLSKPYPLTGAGG